MRNSKRNVNAITVSVWLALILALAGSLRHVAWAFSTIEHGDTVAGYVQAVAVDVGLMMLALGIQQRRRQRRGTAVLWLGVALFSAISVYANFLFGLVHEQEIAAGPLSSLRPILLSATLPMLVLYLAEVAGSDVNYTVLLSEREERRQARAASATEQAGAFPMPIEQARAIKAEQQGQTRGQVLEAMLSIWHDRPDTRIADVARRVGRSRTTVYEYLDALQKAGRVVRDNGTVHVMVEA